jgi:hypothetical protein
MLQNILVSSEKNKQIRINPKAIINEFMKKYGDLKEVFPN